MIDLSRRKLRNMGWLLVYAGGLYGTGMDLPNITHDMAAYQFPTPHKGFPFNDQPQPQLSPPYQPAALDPVSLLDHLLSHCLPP